MERNSIIRYTTLGALTIIGISFGSYLYKQYMLLKNSCYAIGGAIINQISATNFDVSLFLKIRNLSDISITIKDQKYDIYVMDVFVATVTSDKIIDLVKKSDVVIPLDIKFNPAQLFQLGMQNLAALFTDRSQLRIAIKAKLSAKTGIISTSNLTFDIIYTLAELMTPTQQIEDCKKFK